MSCFEIPLQNYFESPKAQFSVLLILSSLCILCILCGIKLWLSIRREKIVIENSEYYKYVLALNKRTSYHRNIARSGKVIYTMHVTSKAKFDRTDTISSLHEYLDFYGHEMNVYLSQVSENRKVYRAYNSEFSGLSSVITREKCNELRIDYDKFQKIEQNLVDSEKLDMIQTLAITCFVEYTSPQGRNSYSKKCTYLESEIRTIIQDRIEQRAYVQSEAYRRRNERAKVTPSLRYDVMRRDDFRCRLCGRSARDGVELEVDHIVPISKGGSSIESNLQTLCRDCNRGKSAKM